MYTSTRTNTHTRMCFQVQAYVPCTHAITCERKCSRIISHTSLFKRHLGMQTNPRGHDWKGRHALQRGVMIERGRHVLQQQQSDHLATTLTLARYSKYQVCILYMCSCILLLYAAHLVYVVSIRSICFVEYLVHIHVWHYTYSFWSPYSIASVYYVVRIIGVQGNTSTSPWVSLIDFVAFWCPRISVSNVHSSPRHLVTLCIAACS